MRTAPAWARLKFVFMFLFLETVVCKNILTLVGNVANTAVHVVHEIFVVNVSGFVAGHFRVRYYLD